VVPNKRLGDTTHPIAHGLGYPAKIDFLHLHVKAFEKSPNRFKKVPANHQACAGDPESIKWSVVLASILLDTSENSASREGDTHSIQKSSAGTAVVESFLILQRAKFRASDTDRGVSF